MDIQKGLIKKALLMVAIVAIAVGFGVGWLATESIAAPSKARTSLK